MARADMIKAGREFIKPRTGAATLAVVFHRVRRARRRARVILANLRARLRR